VPQQWDHEQANDDDKSHLKALDRQTAIKLQSNRKFQFRYRLNAFDMTAIELQTKEFARLHADCNRTTIELHGWFAVLVQSSQLHSNRT
jgi:phage-related protein